MSPEIISTVSNQLDESNEQTPRMRPQSHQALEKDPENGIILEQIWFKMAHH